MQPKNPNFILKKILKKYEVRGNLLCLKCIMEGKEKKCQILQPFNRKFEKAYWQADMIK